MKFKQLLLCAITIALPLSVNAASDKSNDRWFEIEVILFSQLGDKSLLKENFPDGSELPKYRRTEDLLARYLNPDIASLKQLLPSCDSPQYKPDLVSQNAKLPTIFTEKSLADIAQLSSLAESLTAESSVALNELNNSTNSFGDGTATPATSTETTTQPVETETFASQNNSENVSSFENELTAELSDEKRAEIQTLVLAAEAEFSDIKFQYTPKSASQSSDKFSRKVMCRIDEAYFAEVKANDPSFDYNGFTVDKMPLKINAIEDINSDITHLLSKESLKLGDVIQDLRYTKNFRPILHMGWRQVARPKKQSIPMKVYAGDNFAADYQKQLTQYQLEKRQLDLLQLDNDQIEQSPLVNETAVETNQELLLAQAKQKRIASIVEQISSVSDDTELLLNSIEHDDLSLKINSDTALTNEDNIAPIPPVQDWFIDGLFNVHLKHYLFITADFTILDKNLAELATAQLANSTSASTDNGTNDTVDNSALATPNTPVQAKAIRFKQNRRVISGEVHYFDHPYMGMIVQIRPYKKPKPEEDK